MDYIRDPATGLMLPPSLGLVGLVTERVDHIFDPASRLMLPRISGGAAERYLIFNGAVPTTAKRIAVTTGTSLKTMLQVKCGLTANRPSVVEWGISFDASAAATPISVELLTSGTVAATVTAHVASGIENLDPFGTTPTTGNPFDFTTTSTGYTASAEGTITVTRTLDAQLIAPTNQYIKQWPLGYHPLFNQANFLRIRVDAPAAVNALCYVVIEV